MIFKTLLSKWGEWNILRYAFEITFFRDNIPFGPALIEGLRPFDVIVAALLLTNFIRPAYRFRPSGNKSVHGMRI